MNNVKEKRETQIISIRNKIGDITTDTADTKNIF